MPDGKTPNELRKLLDTQAHGDARKARGWLEALFQKILSSPDQHKPGLAEIYNNAGLRHLAAKIMKVLVSTFIDESNDPNKLEGDSQRFHQGPKPFSEIEGQLRKGDIIKNSQNWTCIFTGFSREELKQMVLTLFPESEMANGNQPNSYSIWLPKDVTEKNCFFSFVRDTGESCNVADIRLQLGTNDSPAAFLSANSNEWKFWLPLLKKLDPGFDWEKQYERLYKSFYFDNPAQNESRELRRQYDDKTNTVWDIVDPASMDAYNIEQASMGKKLAPTKTEEDQVAKLHSGR